jgi:hypothetical protein
MPPLTRAAAARCAPLPAPAQAQAPPPSYVEDKHDVVRVPVQPVYYEFPAPRPWTHDERMAYIESNLLVLGVAFMIYYVLLMVAILSYEYARTHPYWRTLLVFTIVGMGVYDCAKKMRWR